MSALAVAFTSVTGASFNITFNEFTGAELARTYDSSVDFERSISGTQLIQGRPGRQKYIWAISSPLSEADTRELDDLFQAWDEDRARGLAAAVGVLDETGFRSVSASAIFSTPPTYTKFGPTSYLVAFGLTEV